MWRQVVRTVAYSPLGPQYRQTQYQSETLSVNPQVSIATFEFKNVVLTATVSLQQPVPIVTQVGSSGCWVGDKYNPTGPMTAGFIYLYVLNNLASATVISEVVRGVDAWTFQVNVSYGWTPKTPLTRQPCFVLIHHKARGNSHRHNLGDTAWARSGRNAAGASLGRDEPGNRVQRA